MHEIQLHTLDLNLLVVLDVLLQEQSVTRAAGRLGRTPSAVSHALGRLRALLGDELLVRDGRRMRRTSRAEGLAETLPRALRQLGRTIADPGPFDAATSTRRFRLAAPDFIAPLVPTLLSDIGAMSPGVRVELAPMLSSTVRELADGRHDALIAPSALDDEGIRGEPLGAWPWAVFARRGHPAFADWSLEAWAAHPHLQIRTTAPRGRGPIDTRAEQLGVLRRVGAVVPQFAMAAPILAQTDMLLTAPSMILAPTAAVYDLAWREPPFELPKMGLSLFRSAAEGDEPGVRWFLERVAQASRGLGEPPGA